MFQKLLERISLALKKQSIEYMVIGGQAVLLYGEPRFTKDIDITLGIGVERTNEMIELAKRAGCKPLVESPADFVKKTMVLPCVDAASGIRVDFIFSFSEYERQAMKRVKRITVGDTEVCFASAEDVVIHKMIAGRPRDLEDVKTILIKNPRLETPYMKEWLEIFERDLAQPFLKRLEEIYQSLKSI